LLDGSFCVAVVACTVVIRTALDASFSTWPPEPGRWWCTTRWK
jgi:hypothetical protein